jgi:hypothetical protein
MGITLCGLPSLRCIGSAALQIPCGYRITWYSDEFLPLGNSSNVALDILPHKPRRFVAL